MNYLDFQNYLKSLNAGVIDSEVGHSDDYEDGGVDEMVAPASIPAAAQPLPPPGPAPQVPTGSTIANDSLRSAADTSPTGETSSVGEPLPPRPIKYESDTLTPPSETGRLSDLLQRYKEGQKSRGNSAQLAQIMRSADIMATGLAGQGAKRMPDEVFSGIENLGQLPLKDVSEEITARPAIQKSYLSERMGDFNSDISNVAKTLIKEKFPNIKGIDNMSAADLEALGFKVGALQDKQNLQRRWQMGQPTLVNGVPVFTRFDVTTGTMESKNPTTGQWEESGGERYYKPEVRTNKLTEGLVRINPTTGQATEVGLPGIAASQKNQAGQPNNKVRKEFNAADRKVVDNARSDLFADKQLEAGREALAGARSAKTMLQFGKAEGKDIMRAVQNMLAKGTGERGVMTENDVAPFKGQGDLWNQMMQMAAGTFKGKFTDANRKFLNSFAGALEKAASNRINNTTQIYSGRLVDDLGVDEDNAKSLLQINQLTKQQYAPGTEVKVKGKKYRVGPDGKSLIPLTENK